MVTVKPWERTRWDRLQACCLIAVFVTVPTLPIVGWVLIHLRFEVL